MVGESRNIFITSNPEKRSGCWVKFYGNQNTLYSVVTSEQTAGYGYGIDATNLRVHENVNDHDISDDEIYVSDTSTGYSSVIFNCPTTGY